MLEIKRVLLPTDFSDSSRGALIRGMDLAQQFGAEVHLLHVALLADAAPVYPLFNLPSDTEQIYKQLHEACESRLTTLAEELAGGDNVRCVLRHASAAAPAILQYAEEEQVDLIAMGTHGRRGARRFLLGSVAEEVVRRTRCPVVTYQAKQDETLDRPQRILAAIDFSEHSSEVVRHARELGALYHARVDFVHVVPTPSFPVFYEFASGTDIYANLSDIRERGLSALEELVRETSGPEVDTTFRVIHGQPADELLRYADQEHCDLIVVATHGLTGVSHLLLGSVAERVLRQASCQVLTVPTAGRSLVRENVA